MIENTDETADPGEDDEWRPKSLRAKPPEWLPHPVKFLILASVLIAHWIALAWWLPRMANPRRAAGEETALLIDFIRDPPPVIVQREPLQARVTPPIPDKTLVPARKRPRILREIPLQASPIASSSTSPPTIGKPKVELYGTDGRIRVPDDLLDQIDRKFGDKRTFSYQVPHMDDAPKAFYRNPPVVYEKTRFDEYWKPDQDLLTGLLTTLVEKTTKQIRIPVPGRPDAKMVCTISLLALGGGCGVLTNGSDYVGPLDDPESLSPEEDQQCKAWWDQIVGATTQQAWRKTRKLYESECRKPLERVPAG